MDKRVIRFDGWQVNFESGEISREGRTHRLQDQPLQILDELTKRPAEVVTRDQLIARLWPTGVVEFDTGLNSAMRKLRIALGDDADTPRYIETLPRKGYRFIAALEPDPPAIRLPTLPSEYQPTSFETGLAAGRRASDRRAPYIRLALGFGSIVAALVLAFIAWRMPAGSFFTSRDVPKILPTVVVLPFVDMSVAQTEEPLCDGLTEELSNWLAHIPNLRVVARTSAFAFKGKNIDVREIAKTLGVTHVLEGSLRRSANQLRITVQLIEATGGLHIWSRSFDMPLGDIFYIEDTVSRSVAEALHIELAAETAERWAARQPEQTQSSSEYYEYYLLGRARQRMRTAEDNLKAVDYFRRSVAANPEYALGLVGLSESLLNGMALNRMPLEDVLAEAEPLVTRALTISPELADALAVKGWLLTEKLRFEEALVFLERATAMNPNDAASHRFIGNLYDRRGNPAKALEHFSISAKLDPMDFLAHVFRCVELVDLGHFEDAGQACARVRALKPDSSWGPLATAWIARARGDSDDAIRWIDEARKLEPAHTGLASQKISLLLERGDTAGARAVLREMPDDSFERFKREAEIVSAERGAAALKSFLAERDATHKATTGAELIELTRLQYMAGDVSAARATLTHAQRVLPLAAADLYDASQIRFEYSLALVQAGIELAQGGDRAKAMKLLADFDRMLDTYEKNGGTHFGLYSLRAASLAMQGKKKEAAAALEDAYQHGWRAAWLARREPYLVGVEFPSAK